VLVLGGLGHSAGVGYLYFTDGVPEANRVLVDVWIAEAQLFGGALYVAASRALAHQRSWRALAIAGAITVIGYAAPMLPVLVARAPVHCRIPVGAYLFLSIVILIRAGASQSRSSAS
jgi:hypothetical protein